MNNLMLLALSILPKPRNQSGEESIFTKDLDVSLFLPGDMQENISYISQMEPLVVWSQKRHPEDFLEVVVLCTKQTVCNGYSLKDPVTAAEFFMTNVCRAIGSTIDLKTYQKDFDAPEKFEDLVQIFEDSDKKIRFDIVPINEESNLKGIQKSVNIIRRWNKEPDRGEFWIDSHGGFRSTMMVLSGIVSLLKIDGIVPSKIYNPKYNSGAKKLELSSEKSSSASFGIFDFVAGMNEFINYGSVGMLMEYYQRRDKTETEDAVLGAMKKVSDGAEESDAESYKQGLDMLGDALGKVGEEKNDRLLNIFRDYLKDSYGDLLYRDKRTNIGIIKRCMEKNLIQQALTFIETLMPGDIVAHGLISYNKQELEQKRKSLSDERKVAWKKEENFLVDAYVNNFFLNPYISEWKGKSPKEKNEIDFFEWRENNKNISYMFIINTAYVRLDFKNPGTAVTVGSKVKNEDKQMAGEFMSLHRALKECRNKYVHCNPERAERQKIVSAIYRYIQIADELMKKYPVN